MLSDEQQEGIIKCQNKLHDVAKQCNDDDDNDNFFESFVGMCNNNIVFISKNMSKHE